MPIDPSIVFQAYRPQTAFDPIGAMQAGQQYGANAMALQAKRRQEEEQQAMDTALSYSTGLGGAPDRQAALRYLNLRGEGRAAGNLQSQWAKSDEERAKAQREAVKENLANQMKMEEFKKSSSQRVVAAIQRGDTQAAQRHWSEAGMQGPFDPGVAWDTYRGSISALDEMKDVWEREKFGKEFGFKQDESKFKRGMEQTKFAADQAESKARIAQGWKGLSLQEQRMGMDAAEARAKPKGMDNRAQIAEIDNTISTIDAIKNHPGFSDAVGVRTPFINQIPGTKAADFRAAVEPLKSQIFLNQIQKMRGMGSLSNAEGMKVEAAISSLDFNQSEKQFKNSLDRIKGHMEKLKQYASQEGGSPQASEPQEKVATLAEIRAAAQRSGKTVDQVTKDAMAKGWKVR